MWPLILFLTLANTAPVHPPQVVQQIEAMYPETGLPQESTVVLLVTVGIDGSVTEVSVATSGGEVFDNAAIEAMRAWKFQPARQGNAPVVSRIKVPFNFTKPTPVAIPAPVGAVREPPVPSITDEHIIDVSIHGTRKAPPRAISDFVLDRAALTTAPHRTTSDLLSSAPGVYVSQPEGDAVAHEIYLRGFNAEHGQDIELTLGAIPLNQPSHIHGQGYADLNFIIPEVVRSLRVTEGVYDPRQGDFAVAGSINFDLGVAERGYQLKSSYGSFNTFRQLVLWAPKDEAEETFGAFSIRKSDGFGQNRGSISGSAMGQYAFEGPARFKGILHVSGYGARAGLAGILRQDDIDAGRVGFFDTYNNPSANSQSALTARAQTSVTLDRTNASGAHNHIATWFTWNTLRTRTNFTGFTQRGMIHPEWIGRGDLIEQFNQDLGIGAQWSRRTSEWKPLPWLFGHMEFGTSFRMHLITQTQNLLQAPQNKIWDQRVDANVRATDIGFYADINLHLTRFAILKGGVRTDVLHYDIDDRLGNFIPSSIAQTHLVGFHRTAVGVAVGPRATLEIKPLSWLTLMASYGEGYRSPQARQLAEGENAPFAKVRSYEGGFRIAPHGGDRIAFSSAAYATTLDNDLVFDPEEGRLERIGPTQRVGFVSHVTAKPFAWATASASVTYVHATLRDPPPATAENPAPAFQSGQLLPYVPPVVVRTDLGVHRDLIRLWTHHVHGRLGLGGTFLSPRPLPYAQSTPHIFLLDLSGSVRWHFIELSLEMFNLTDTRYAASAYSFVSNWGNRDVPSMLPQQHISAGAPRTFMGTLGLHF